MALNWSTIKREDVERACELLSDGQHVPRTPPKGLFVVVGDRHLPAKHTVRLAYCLANNLPLDTNVKFASGEGTLKLLRSLGFAVERRP